MGVVDGAGEACGTGVFPVCLQPLCLPYREPVFKSARSIAGQRRLPMTGGDSRQVETAFHGDRQGARR